MLRSLKNKLKRLRRRRRSQDGQAITEYGAIIAFIAVLVALVFAFSSGAVGGAISNCFSSITSQLDQMAASASVAS